MGDIHVHCKFPQKQKHNFHNTLYMLPFLVAEKMMDADDFWPAMVALTDKSFAVKSYCRTLCSHYFFHWLMYCCYHWSLQC